jgi:hypothetical protein
MVYDVEASPGLHGAVNDGAAHTAPAELIGNVATIDHTGVVDE